MKRFIFFAFLIVSVRTLAATSALESRIDSLVHIGLCTKAFPGCQVYVAVGDSLLINKAYGYTDYTARHPVTASTIYDLASVSKAAGTLPGIMAAFDDRLFNLDDSICRFIPELAATPKGAITMRQLLYHESGMPAWLPAIKSFKRPNRDSVQRMIHAVNLRPDKSYTYSCLNFCLLMEIEERLTGEAHDRWVDRRIFKPLGMNRTLYRPLGKFKLSEIAPTELDTIQRGKLLHGEVHDEIAYYSGGVQGNAGLFASAEDLGRLCRMWLRGGFTEEGDTVLSAATVRLFTCDKSPHSRRGLGFDRADPDHPNASPTTPLATPGTYGHLGFTGTCFWVDPECKIVFVFLCNRVHPSRDNQAFATLDIRPKLLEAVYLALDGPGDRQK